MNRVKKTAFNLYGWFWFHTAFWLEPKARRPYTYIMRDFYHDHPILTIFLIIWGTYIFNLFVHIGWQDWLKISIGLLLGHLFWGAKWIHGQQEDPEYNPDAKP